eukprot:4013685-Alexandrium_andersonii.AAC.1
MADYHCAFGRRAAGVVRHQPPQVPRRDCTAIGAVGMPPPAQLGRRDIARDLGPSRDGRRRPFMDNP